MMRMKLRFLAVAVAIAALAVSGGFAVEDKPASISDIMTKAHKGGDSLKAQIQKGLKAAEPNWAEVKKDTEELVKLGKDLIKNEPPKGTKVSWEKLAGAYAKNAELLDSAVGKKEKEVAGEAFKATFSTCGACHKAHR